MKFLEHFAAIRAAMERQGLWDDTDGMFYDRIVTPLMRVRAQGRSTVADNAGNVFEPAPAREAVRGRWPHIWG